MATNTPFKKRFNPLDALGGEKEEKYMPKKTQKMRLKDEDEREKYTATMQKSLRRRIKVAAAMTGVQVSSFIEQACMEKLEREGIK